MLIRSSGLLCLFIFNNAAIEPPDRRDNENSGTQKVFAACSEREGLLLPWPENFWPVGIGEVLNGRERQGGGGPCQITAMCRPAFRRETEFGKRSPLGSDLVEESLHVRSPGI